MHMKQTSPKIIKSLLVVLLFFSSATAFAQSRNLSDEDAAVEHFDNGARLFYEGDFSGAIVEFRKAYDYNPDPMILYNISLAHERLKNFPEAMRVGKTAAANPNLPPPVALRNDARLAAFSIALTADKITTRTASDAKNAAIAAGFKSGFANQPDATPIWDRLSPVGWSGIASASAGVILLAYSGIVNYGLSADIARYQTTPDPHEYNRLKNDITTRSKRGRITLYTGSALAVVGAGLLTFDLLYNRSSEPDEPTDLLGFSQKPTLKLGFSPINSENLVQISGTY